MTLKIGIIGAGRMTQLAHIPNLMQIGGVEVVALADIDTALADRVAARFHIPRVYDSSAALVDGENRLDGVLVVTPRMQHAATCLPVLERRIPSPRPSCKDASETNPCGWKSPPRARIAGVPCASKSMNACGGAQKSVARIRICFSRPSIGRTSAARISLTTIEGSPYSSGQKNTSPI